MRVLLLALIGLSLPAFAQSPGAGARRALTVTGTVQPGPCPNALTLVSDAGERYELDPGRLTAKVGQHATFRGKLYPRISICRAHAWLDIQTVTPAEPHAPEALQAATPDEAKAVDLTTGQVILVVGLDQLGEGLKQARALRARLPKSMQVAVGIPAHQRRLLPQLFAVTRNDFDLMQDIQVLALAEDMTAKVLVRVGEDDIAFPSIEALLEELKRRAGQTG